MAEQTANVAVADEEEVYVESKGSSIPPHPRGGYQGVIVDYQDLGKIPSTYQGVQTMVDTILITWQTKEIINIPDDPTNKLNGQRYAISRRFTKSMAETANFRKMVEKLFGRKLTAEEAKRFPISRILGMNCYLTLEASKDDEYTNIKDVTRWTSNLGPDIVAEGYVRKKDRPKDGQQQGQDGTASKGEAVNRLKNTLALAESYGIKPNGAIDFDKLTIAQIEKAITDFAAATTAEQDRRTNAIVGDDTTFDDGPAELAPTPALAPVAASPTPSPATSPTPDIAPQKITVGSLDFIKTMMSGKSQDLSKIADPFMQTWGVKAWQDLTEEQAKILIAAVKPSYDEKLKAEQAKKAAPSQVAQKFEQAANNSDPAGEAAFNDPARKTVEQAWIAAGHEELKENIREIIDAAEKAGLPTAYMIDNDDVIEAVNKFHDSVGRGRIANLTELKTAGSKLVAAKIEEGLIDW